jgi:hypothetical protein
VLAISENTVNKTFMTGVADFMSAMTPSPTQESDLVGFSARASGGLNPFSGLMRDARKVQDPLMREAFTYVEKLRNGVPFLSDDLSPRLDLYGEPITYQQVFNPWFVSSGETDPVILHIGDLAQSTQESVITKPKKTINGVALTSSEYYKYLELSRKKIKLNDMAFKEALSSVISTDEYQNLMPSAKADELKNVQSKFDQAARAQMVNPNNIEWFDYQTRLTKKITSEAEKFGGEEVAGLVKEKLKEIGF